MYRCFSACLTPCDVLTVKSRAERIETPLLILTAGYFLDASYIAVDDERVICIIDNKTGFCAFWFFNMFFLYIIDFDFFAASQKTYLHIIQELENKDIDLVMRSLSGLS